MTVIKAKCINLISNAYFTRVKIGMAYISIGRRGVGSLLRKGVPVCRPRLSRVMFHGGGRKHLRFAASVAAYLSGISVIFDTIKAPPSRSNDTSLGCILRITHAMNQGVGGCLMLMAGSAIPMNATRGMGTTVYRRLGGQKISVPFSITDGPRFLGRKTTVGSFVDPSHIIVKISSRETGGIVDRLCHPLVLGGFHIVFASVPDTRVVGCTTGSVLTAHVDFVGSVTGLYRLIKTSIGVIHGNVNTSDHVKGGFLCPKYNCKNSYFPGSIGTLVGATRGRNCRVHILGTIRRMGRGRGSLLFQGLSNCCKNSLGNEAMAL